MDWDPLRYLSFADERVRAFVELLARVGAEAPTTVVDLGSGPGTFTELLHKRWPRAHVIGVDSSPTMVEFATREIPGVDFVLEGFYATKKISRSDERGYHASEPAVRRPSRESLTADDSAMPSSGSKKKYYN